MSAIRHAQLTRDTTSILINTPVTRLVRTLATCFTETMIHTHATHRANRQGTCIIYRKTNTNVISNVQINTRTIEMIATYVIPRVWNPGTVILHTIISLFVISNVRLTTNTT